MKLSSCINIFRYSILKTILFNLYYLPLSRALSFPLKVYHGVKVKSLGRRSAMKLLDSKAVIRIGKKGSFGMGRKTYWCVSKSGTLTFHGDAIFSKGTQLIVNGNIEFGKSYSNNVNCIINSSKNIVFGDDVLIGWESTIIDGDGHEIISNGVPSERSEEIIIGNHVWIASYTRILKGSEIRDNSVVAMNALVSKKFCEENILIGGINKKINEKIDWRK